MNEIPKKKKCKKCDEPVFLDDFPKRPKANDGRDSTCKECTRAKANLRYRNSLPQW